MIPSVPPNDYQVTFKNMSYREVLELENFYRERFGINSEAHVFVTSVSRSSIPPATSSDHPNIVEMLRPFQNEEIETSLANMWTPQDRTQVFARLPKLSEDFGPCNHWSDKTRASYPRLFEVLRGMEILNRRSELLYAELTKKNELYLIGFKEFEIGAVLQYLLTVPFENVAYMYVSNCKFLDNAQIYLLVKFIGGLRGFDVRNLGLNNLDPAQKLTFMQGLAMEKRNKFFLWSQEVSPFLNDCDKEEGNN